MTLKRFGCGAAVAVTLGLFALWAVVTYVPSVHPIHSAGARSANARFAALNLPFRGKVPAPTTSLRELRCAVWYELKGQACTDPATIAQRLWPELTDAPATIYVPSASGDGVTLGGPSGFNVEYQPGLRTLTVHNYVAQPLFVWRHPDSMPGAALAPGLSLLVVSADRISSGLITIQEDAWIERITGDEASSRDMLGTVAIS